jgi:hypothetical protein
MRIHFTSGVKILLLLIACTCNIFVYAEPEVLPLVNGTSKSTTENPPKFWFKLPESIPVRPLSLKPFLRSFRNSVDPIRFSIICTKSSVVIGEEIDLTIRAELLDISPSLMFFFEEQKSFALKLLVPDGFELTGGTYSDFIGTTLNLQSQAVVEYTVKGKFLQYTEASTFTLLRGPSNATAQSLFEKKDELVLALQPACTLQPDQVSVFEPLEGILVIQVPQNPTDYLYSLDNSTFYTTNFFPNNRIRTGTVYIREKQNPSCLLAVNYSFAKLKVNKGPVLFSGSPCDDPNAKPVVVDGGGGALSVYNCSGTQIWLHDNIYLPATQGANTISACNEGNGSYTVYCSTGYGGCTDNQYSDPVYVSSCVAQCPPHWAVTGSTRCNGNALESEEVYTSACDYSFARLAYSAVGETRWVVTDPCGCSDHQPDFRGTNQTRCSGEVLEKEMQDMSACSPTSGQTIWHIISTCGCSNFQPLWEATGAIRCDASTNYQEQREERDTKGCSPTIGQLRWIGTGQTCQSPADWQNTGNTRCDGSTNYQQEREERDVAQSSATFDQTRWIQTGQSCTPGANWQNTGNTRCDASTNYQQEREERDVAQGSLTFDQTRWLQTGQTCTPGANWQGTGAFRCDASTNYQEEREERDVAQGSPTFDQTRWIQTGQSCTPGANWQSTSAFRCDASTNFQEEREERDVAQGSPTFDQTRWIQTGQSCIPGANWQGTGNFRCDASTNFQQEREERDIAQGSSTYDQTRWLQTGQTCLPGANWQETGNTRCDASTNFQQEREERDVAQGSLTFDQTRWTSTGQTCTPGANWQGTGIFRCDASTNFQQEREERDVAQGSPTYDQTRWVQTDQTCTPSASWQGTGNFRCDASTNYQQEREERDVAQGSPTFDQTRWIQTGQSCTPGANWQGTGSLRCDASTNFQQEREERDMASGSPTFNQTRWTQTGQSCTPGENWQTTGNVRCNATANRLEHEERDMASGSPTFNQNRWILTTDCCPMVVPTVNAQPAVISSPQAVTLTATGCVASVQWSGPGGISTGAVLIVNVSQTTTFNALCIDGSCQSPAAPVTVQMITVPAPIIRTSHTTLCKGDTLHLSADGCEGLVRWSNGLTGSSIRFAPTATATYSATCVVSGISSEASNTIGISVQTAPTGATAITSQSSYTTGQTVSLSATAAAATRYEWSGPGGFTATGQSINQVNATVGMGGTYTVRAYSGASCPAVATVSVVVQPSVSCTLAFDGEPLADCDFSATDTTRRGRITVKVKNQQATSQLQIALYQSVVNGGQTSYQLTSILPNSPAVFTGLKQGAYRIDAFEVTGNDTCKAGSRLLTIDCDTTVSPCEIRIKSVDSQGTETDVLPRIGGTLQPLMLSVEHLTGASLAGFTYQWMRTTGTGAAVNLATSPSLSATAIGEYAVKLMTPSDTCTAYLTLRSKPCTPRTHTYACGTTPAIPLPDNGSRLSNLAPGDTIRAADFDIIVTEVAGGGSEGWNGIGYTEIPYLQGSKIAIELKGVVVNECYELVGGTAVSAYDPNWAAVKPIDKVVTNAVTAIKDLLAVYTANDKAKLKEYANKLDEVKQAYQDDDGIPQEAKEAIIYNTNIIQSKLNELASCDSSSNSPNGRRAVSGCPDPQTIIALMNEGLPEPTVNTQKRTIEFGKFQWQDSLGRDIKEEISNKIHTSADIRLIERKIAENGGVLGYWNEYLNLNYTEKFTRDIYENGYIVDAALGVRDILSANSESRIIDNFYNGKQAEVAFEIGGPVSNKLIEYYNDTFSHPYIPKFMSRVNSSIKEGKFNDLTGEFVFDVKKYPEAIGLPNFSIAREIPFYDFYGIMGGTQKIMVEMELKTITQKGTNFLGKNLKSFDCKVQKLNATFHIIDWYGADAGDINGKDFKKSLSSSLSAFFMLQHYWGVGHPFQTRISAKLINEQTIE